MVESPTRVLHIGDSRVEERPGREPIENLGGLALAHERARELDVDAIVFSGNLLGNGTNADRFVPALVQLFDGFEADNIQFYYIDGRLDSSGDANPWDRLSKHPAVEPLRRAPTNINDDLILYGLDHRPADKFEQLLDTPDNTFTPAMREAPRIVVLNQKIAPPADRSGADARAAEITSSLNLHIDAFACGGFKRFQAVEHEETGHGVYYPGTCNPDWLHSSSEPPRGMLYEVRDDHELRRHQIVLEAVEMPKSAETLERVITEYQTLDLDNTDTGTLIDMYGLLAEARSVLESRRKEVRDVLQERLPPGETAAGSLATIYYQSTTSRELRDTETVLAELENAGIKTDQVTETVTEVDQAAVEKVVEAHSEVPWEAVFEEQTHESIQKRDVAIDGSN